jgi:DNA-binding MarR family transcriptional regulator
MHNGRLLQRAIEEDLSSIGLHHGQGRILLAIASRGGITQADLARLMDVKPSTITNMLKPLEQKKLISRKLDEKTNRALIVLLTSAGERACNEIQAAWDRIEVHMRNHLPSTAIPELFQTLETIRSALGGKDPTDRENLNKKSA